MVMAERKMSRMDKDKILELEFHRSGLEHEMWAVPEWLRFKEILSEIRRMTADACKQEGFASARFYCSLDLGKSSYTVGRHMQRLLVWSARPMEIEGKRGYGEEFHISLDLEKFPQDAVHAPGSAHFVEV